MKKKRKPCSWNIVGYAHGNVRACWRHAGRMSWVCHGNVERMLVECWKHVQRKNENMFVYGSLYLWQQHRGSQRSTHFLPFKPSNGSFPPICVVILLPFKMGLKNGHVHPIPSRFVEREIFQPICYLLKKKQMG
jgi:hypothetical protein